MKVTSSVSLIVKNRYVFNQIVVNWLIFTYESPAQTWLNITIIGWII